MSGMFEILYSAMKKDRAVFIEDAFFTFTDKGDHVTSANFFSLNDEATVNLLKRLEEIADGRRIKISLSKDEEQAPEVRVLSAHGYVKTTSKTNTQHWENRDAPHAA
jgi:hypothetical protein